MADDCSPLLDTNFDNPSTLSFPTLQPDGSLSTLLHRSSHHSTPPAALSSLGQKKSKAAYQMSESMDSLADGQYDIIQREDFSDHYDDADTASIASTADDDEHEGLVEVEEVHCPTSGLNIFPTLIDDLDDTPRQSTFTPFQPQVTCPPNSFSVVQSSIDAVNDHSEPSDIKVAEQLCTGTRSSKMVSMLTSNMRSSATVLVLVMLATLQLFGYLASPTPLSQHDSQKEALASSLAKATNTSNASKIFDLDHLLPRPEIKTDSVGGLPFTTYVTQKDVRFQAMSPNRFVVSLPAVSYFFAPQLHTVKVHRGDQELAFNRTRLISGVYEIVFDVEHAYGLITVDMIMKHSAPQSSASHNFGSRILQRHTYEKATTELSRTVSEQSLVARKAAVSITEWLHNELTVSVPRDIRAVTAHVQRVTKDLIIAEQKGLVLMGDGIKKIVTTTKDQTAKVLFPTRRLLKTHLGASIHRSQALKKKLLDGGRAVLGSGAKKAQSTSCSSSLTSVSSWAAQKAERAARKSAHRAELNARKSVRSSERTTKDAVQSTELDTKASALLAQREAKRSARNVEREAKKSAKMASGTKK